MLIYKDNVRCETWCQKQCSASSCFYNSLSQTSCCCQNQPCPCKNLELVLCPATVSSLLCLISHFLSVCVWRAREGTFNISKLRLRAFIFNTTKWHQNHIQVRLTLDVKKAFLEPDSVQSHDETQRKKRKSHLWAKTEFSQWPPMRMAINYLVCLPVRMRELLKCCINPTVGAQKASLINLL